VLGFEHDGPDVGYLYLEYVRAARAWPWRETPAATRVLELLGSLHARLPEQRLREPDLAWDYEAELTASAWTTLELFERVASGVDLAWLRAARGALRRTCAALPDMRQALLSAGPFGTCVIHGDVHSGNTILAPAGEGERVVLLDWARARRGSPFEDVASWLQSLGYWEPEARRRHDTLLRSYLVSRGQPAELSRQLRDTYWLAAASNVLAGALRYHLAVAADRAEAPSAARAEAARAARDQLRVLRRANLLWRA
jgi:aminoglycoside phosphotransferase (APT) family kinase protein